MSSETNNALHPVIFRAEHFSGGAMPHEPARRLSDELMAEVQANVSYACTDVALRNPETGEIFLGARQTEPQIGPWFIGGRDQYAVGTHENAALQVKNDIGLDIKPGRFSFVASIGTDFPIAAPGNEASGRDTQNAAMIVDLKPEEITQLNQHVSEGKLRDEYSNGSWYDPSEIAPNDSDFPFALKHFVRALYMHDRLRDVVLEDAYHEHEARQTVRKEMGRAAEVVQKAAILESMGLASEEVSALREQAGSDALYSIIWANHAREVVGKSVDDQIKNILDNSANGDVHIKRELKKLGLKTPRVTSENGPKLRNILTAATLAFEYDDARDGQLFDATKELRDILVEQWQD